MNEPLDILQEVERIKTQLEFHESEARKFRQILSKIATSLGLKTANSRTAISANPPTVEEVVVSIFNSDSTPRTVRKLRDDYEKRTNKKPGSISIPDFSSRIITLMKKKQIKIGKQTFPENPTPTRTYYGLSQWVSNGKFKKQYLEKINKKVLPEEDL